MDGTASTEHVTSQQVSVVEAAAILGVSVVTVRRMIKRGQLEAQRVIRPRGSAYLVTVHLDGTGNTVDATRTERPAQNVSRPNGTPSELMAVWSETFLAPLIARTAEQEAVIRDQAETIGELRAENRALLSRTEAQIARSTSEPSVLFLRRRWLWVTVLVAFVVAITLLVAWPR
jgi:excisionase family DNA binding protein